MKRKTRVCWAIIAAGGFGLLFAQQAFAASAAAAQYGTCTGSTYTCSAGGGLPFTGLALGTIVAIGVIFIGGGVVTKLANYYAHRRRHR